MDEDTHPDNNGNNSENQPIKREGEEVHPAAWTPEDASRFLFAAIHEAQKPLTDALKRRPATTPVLALIVVILVAAAAAIAWILSSQLSKSETDAETSRTARDSALAQQYELQSKADTLEARLAVAEEEQERLNQEHSRENESLRNQAEGKRDSEEELRKARSELVRYRRQNELLKTQISGLEMEKQALSRQLDAVKAMAIDEDPGELVPIEDAPISDPVSETLPVPVDAEPPATSAGNSGISTLETEPPLQEAPKLDAGIPVAPERKADANGLDPTAETPAEVGGIEANYKTDFQHRYEPEHPDAIKEGKWAGYVAYPNIQVPADRITISDARMEPMAGGTVTVESVSEGGKDAGTVTLGEDGRNLPVLHESNGMANESVVNAAASDSIQITSAGMTLSGTETESEETTREPVETLGQAEAKITPGANPESISKMSVPGEDVEAAKPDEKNDGESQTESTAAPAANPGNAEIDKSAETGS